MLSIALSHLFPACPFVPFFHTALSTMVDNLFLDMFLTFHCPSDLLVSVFVFGGYNPNAALKVVLLVVFEHLCTFIAAIICTVFSCYTNFVFPSHSFSAYSSSGTITFIRIYLSILVSTCESLRIMSVLPICALPSPTTLSTCASQETGFYITTPRFVHWFTSGNFTVFLFISP